LRALAALLAVGVLGPACVSRSPFATSPAEVARAEPCRYMGTVHKESRQRLEVLRACGSVSEESWLCMARALEALDGEFTARCRKESVRLREIVLRQRALYEPCLAAGAGEVAECALLSSDDDCLARGCSAEVSPAAYSEAAQRGRFAKSAPQTRSMTGPNRSPSIQPTPGTRVVQAAAGARPSRSASTQPIRCTASHAKAAGAAAATPRGSSSGAAARSASR
jgi:hypothetical protein